MCTHTRVLDTLTGESDTLAPVYGTHMRVFDTLTRESDTLIPVLGTHMCVLVTLEQTHVRERPMRCSREHTRICVSNTLRVCA
jgi:hypothetical protein